jgi:catechol 2,3-dioxygenase-like lactoylglutathione lyase family enzyme
MALPARFLYSGIRVQKLERAVAFYRKMGFRVESKGTMGHGGQWVHLQFPGSRHLLELNYYPPGNPYFEPPRSGTEFDHFGFYTTDVAGWLRRGLRAGATLAADFTDGKSRLIYLADPDGIELEFFGPVHPPRRRRPRA